MLQEGWVVRCRGQDVARDIAAGVYAVQSKGIVGHLNSSKVLLDEHDRACIAAADLVDPLQISDATQAGVDDVPQEPTIAPELLQVMSCIDAGQQHGLGLVICSLVSSSLRNLSWP